MGAEVLNALPGALARGLLTAAVSGVVSALRLQLPPATMGLGRRERA
jgi:hypothetical protein